MLERWTRLKYADRAHQRFPKTTKLGLAYATVFYARGQADSVAATFGRVRASQTPQRRALAARGLAGLALRRGRVTEAIHLLGEARAEDTQRGASGSPFEDSVTVSLINAWFDTQPARAAQRLDALLARVSFNRSPWTTANTSRSLRSMPWRVVPTARARSSRNSTPT